MTLLGPDKLSEMTKEIGKGLVTGVDMDAVSKIGFTFNCIFMCVVLLLSFWSAVDYGNSDTKYFKKA